MDDLYSLFKECIETEYTTVGLGADLAFRREANTLYIFFECSDGVVDWMNNLSFLAVPYRDMEDVWRCHGGFLRVFKSITTVIENAISEPSVKEIIMVGYSHGAALALLCHEYVWFNYPDIRENIRGYGYGCPRVIHGSPSADTRRRWKNFTLVQHRGDIVTHLPPLLLGYTHVGKKLRIGKRGLSSIDAHRPKAYLDALYNLTF